MPLVTTARAGSANSNTPSRVITRQEVSVARPTASTSRAEALKSRLTGKIPSQPVAPRPARTSGRAEEMAKLQKYGMQQPQKPQITPRTSARGEETNLLAIAPPPSGLAPGQQEVIQPVNSVETPSQAPVASGEQENPQFASLAREERRLRKARQEFKAQQDAWKLEQAKYISKDRLRSETLKVLAEAEITPDKLVELQINQATAQDPQQLLLNRISELELQIKGITDPENGTLAKRDNDAYTAAVSQIRSDAKLVVDSNPAFGTIKSEGNTEDVVELITSVFSEEGIVLDVEEAASLVESKLKERLDKQFEKLNKFEWLRAKYGKQAEPAEANTEKQSQPRINTLTNAGATTRPLSARDRAVLLVQERLDAQRKGK